MSDVNLLVFGCGVSFIAVAGAYVYIRECFTAEEPPRQTVVKAEEPAPAKIRDVA